MCLFVCVFRRSVCVLYTYFICCVWFGYVLYLYCICIAHVWFMYCFAWYYCKSYTHQTVEKQFMSFDQMRLCFGGFWIDKISCEFLICATSLQILTNLLDVHKFVRILSIFQDFWKFVKRWQVYRILTKESNFDKFNKSWNVAQMFKTFVNSSRICPSCSWNSIYGVPHLEFSEMNSMFAFTYTCVYIYIYINYTNICK